MSTPPDERGRALAAVDAPTGPLSGAGAPAPAATLADSEVLAGRFRIVRLLGRGGMGEVYQAEDLELRERIALKIVPRSLARDERALERFRQETNLARRVTHPNVCRLFDVFHHRSEDGPALAFVTMELLPGETLKQRLQRLGRFPFSEVRPIVAQMLDAVAAAHAAGVIHQDLKSANVMLVDAAAAPPRAVITDFGLARGHKRGDDSTPNSTQGEILGTLAYMAPEQIIGAAVTPATDIFALGVVLYEMVTGTLPFRHAPSVSPLLRPDPVSPDERAPGLDRVWARAIMRCLRPRAEDRFAQIVDLQAALGLEAGRAPRLERELRRALKRQWILGPLAVAVAVALGLWAGRGQAPKPAAPLHAVQLTTSAGLDVFPAVSPDGSRLAYSANNGRGFELQLLSLTASARPQLLNTEAGDDIEPAWSPDGNRVAFHSLAKGGLWVIPTLGGRAQRVADFGARPVWSPDGRSLAFQSDALSPLDANAVPARPPSTIWTVRVDAAVPLQITEPGKPPGGHGTPTWSPDGSRLVFAAYERNRSALWSVPAGGGPPESVIEDAGYIYDPVWAAGQLAYTARTARGAYGVMRVALDDDGRALGDPQLLTAVGLGTPRHLALSPDGRRLYYSALSLSSNLWWLPLNAAGGVVGPAVPLTRETGRNSRPAFSHDAALLAFEKWSTGETPAVWLMDREGGYARALDSHSARDDAPSFSSDGRVVFLSQRGGDRALWSVEPGQGQADRLCSLPRDAEFPRLSPDGRTAVFNSSAETGTTNLWLLPICGEPTALTHDPELLGFAAWSPDGRELAAQQRRGESARVALVSVADGAIRVLTQDEQDWAYSFSPDGGRIAFARLRDGVWNLWWVSRDPEPVSRQLTFYTTPHGYVRYPAWSPANDGIVYEYAESRGNVWQLELP